VPAEETPDRVRFDHDTGRIWIVAGRNDFSRRRRPKPFIFGLQSQLTAYQLAMVLDGRHPYWKLGEDAKDEERGDIRRTAIRLSPRCRKFFDTIIGAYRAEPRRLKSVPTAWSEETDETSVTFIVADGLEVILDELADEFAALGDGGIIGQLRTQRDTARAEREAQAAPADKRQDDGGELARSFAEQSKPPQRRRAAYGGPLEGWMANVPVEQLRRMGLAAIANEFKRHCEEKCPELLPLLPKRLRSMEPLIERIIVRRVAALESRAKEKKNR
jgi:hypothetical protein